MSNSISVALSVDNNVITPFKVFVFSLCEHSPKLAALDFLILIDEQTLTGNAKEDISSFLNSKNIRFSFIECRKLISSKIKWSPDDHVSIATYFRLFFLDQINTIYERIIYFDVDMIVVNDITELMEIEFFEPIASVTHYSSEDEHRLWQGYGGGYFNAGLIIFNLKHDIVKQLSKKSAEVLQTEQDRILWHDQDVLNIIFEDNWYRLHSSFNVTRAMLNAVSISDLKIIHFDGWKKPWRFGTRRPYFQNWLNTYEIIFNKKHPNNSTHSKLIAHMRELKSRIRRLIT